MTVNYETLKKDGFMCQKQKNTFSLRIRVVGGKVTTKQLLKIQEVADRFGKGYVHLTSRQGIEIPYIKLEDIKKVKMELEEGKCRAGACGPQVRTVTACQGNTVCLSGNIDSYKVAEELDRRYHARVLPHKFKIGVTGCQNNCLKAEENDLGVKGILSIQWKAEACTLCGLCEKACRLKALTTESRTIVLDFKKCNHCGRCVKACPMDAWQSESAYEISVGGLFGNTISKGRGFLPPVTSDEQLYRITDAVIHYFEKYGNSGERLKFTIDRVGWDKFEEVMKAAYDG